MSENSPQEFSEAGNPIYRHQPRTKPFEPVIGDEQHIEKLSQHIAQHLGEPATVFHEIISDLVHIDIHIIPPRPDRNFYTLVTTGMSQRPMTVPPGAEEFARCELMLSLPPDWPLQEEDLKDENHYWPLRLLKTLARMPHEYDTWLSIDHTIPNGDPAEPYAENTKFCCALIGFPLTAPTEDFMNCQVSPETVVRFWSVIPLYPEEVDFKLKKGAEALGERMDKEEITDLLDLSRKNVGIGKKLFGLF